MKTKPKKEKLNLEKEITRIMKEPITRKVLREFAHYAYLYHTYQKMSKVNKSNYQKKDEVSKFLFHSSGGRASKKNALTKPRNEKGRFTKLSTQ